MNVWEIAILRWINSIGDAASLKQMYKRIGKFKELSKSDLRTTEHGGRPAYQHQMRSHISNLYQTGEVKRISRGLYSLTANGLKRISA